MTERMSNIEIEDVLSSIRRLVSDDLHPKPVTTPARSTVPRLVLTQALRVDPLHDRALSSETDQGSSGDTLVHSESSTEAGSQEQASQSDFALADRLAELEVLLDQQATGFEDEAAHHEIASVTWAATPDQVPEAPFIPDTEASWAAADTTLADDSAPDAGFDDHAGPDAEDDAPLTLDEDVLRELIRDVLREELQGPMGARVTRNLRKLVRAEIARALTSRGIA